VKSKHNVVVKTYYDNTNNYLDPSQHMYTYIFYIFLIIYYTSMFGSLEINPLLAEMFCHHCYQGDHTFFTSVNIVILYFYISPIKMTFVLGSIRLGCYN